MFLFTLFFNLAYILIPVIYWIFVYLLNLYVEFLILSITGGGVFGRWLSHESGSSWMGLVLLWRICQRIAFYHVRTHQEDSFLWIRKQPLPDTESASAFLLDYPASRNVRNKHLFKPSSLWYSVIASQTKTNLYNQRLISYFSSFSTMS